MAPQITADRAKSQQERILHKQRDGACRTWKTGMNTLMEIPAQVGSASDCRRMGGISEYRRARSFSIAGDVATTVCVVDQKKNYSGDDLLACAWFRRMMLPGQA